MLALEKRHREEQNLKWPVKVSPSPRQLVRRSDL
jgi:hypothetical protein